MDSDHSNQVVDSYKQHKLNLSVFARIRALIDSFEAGDALDRSLARFGLAIVAVLVLAAIYYFVSSSQVVIF